MGLDWRLMTRDGFLKRAWMATLAPGFTLPVPKKLRDVVKLPLLEKQPTAKVRTIWMEHYRDHPTVVADVLSGAAHDQFTKRAARFPMFVFPVLRPKGFITLLSQYQEKHFLMTSLEEYRQSAVLASPCFILSNYDDLVETKSISLLRGEAFIGKVSKDEGQRCVIRWDLLQRAMVSHSLMADMGFRLMELVQKFYLGQGSELALLQAFNEQPVRPHSHRWYRGDTKQALFSISLTSNRS
mmetsp:Transcript_6615/g.13392  ORF Transcript_6615/g.13392 Transcript_6615/m.13392 type:complete len:240 (-) Transcript_6615:927-1646(-)